MARTVPGKTGWHDLYSSSDPAVYFETMTPFDYGSFQDRFVEFVSPFLNSHFSPSQQLKAVEFGALFGNTTLAYRADMGWGSTGEFWVDEAKSVVPVREVSVTGVDLSEQALTYGLRRGVFDEIFVENFNSVLSHDLQCRITDADLLVLVMVSSYIKTSSVIRICSQFLSTRDKRKVFIFNNTLAFDGGRNFSPEALFSNVRGWTARTHFLKHRNFTDEEAASRHGNRESWCQLFLVVFEPQEE